MTAVGGDADAERAGAVLLAWRRTTPCAVVSAIAARNAFEGPPCRATKLVTGVPKLRVGRMRKQLLGPIGAVGGIPDGTTK
eukprot:1129648-Pyramimonas_sp.AAC.1